MDILKREGNIPEKKKGYLETAISLVNVLQNVTKGEIYWRKKAKKAKKFGKYRGSGGPSNEGNFFLTSLRFVQQFAFF